MRIKIQDLKLFASIFSLYILLLAVVPCCAIDDCPDETTEAQADHSQSSDDCDTCSPFFNCQTCPTATIGSADVFEPARFASILDFVIPHSFSVTRHASDFWQPPRRLKQS